MCFTFFMGRFWHSEPSNCKKSILSKMSFFFRLFCQGRAEWLTRQDEDELKNWKLEYWHRKSKRQPTCMNGIALTPPTSLNSGIYCSNFSSNISLNVCILCPVSTSVSPSSISPVSACPMDVLGIPLLLVTLSGLVAVVSGITSPYALLRPLAVRE